MSDYIDRNGKEITLEEWGKLMENKAARSVALDVIDHVRVSTVWLGLDHQHTPGGPPLIFETMVFGGENDDYCRRYSTEAEAIAGHKAVCDAIRAGELIGAE